MVLSRIVWGSGFALFSISLVIWWLILHMVGKNPEPEGPQPTETMTKLFGLLHKLNSIQQRPIKLGNNSLWTNTGSCREGPAPHCYEMDLREHPQPQAKDGIKSGLSNGTEVHRERQGMMSINPPKKETGLQGIKRHYQLLLFLFSQKVSLKMQ